MSIYEHTNHAWRCVSNYSSVNLVKFLHTTMASAVRPEAARHVCYTSHVVSAMLLKTAHPDLTNRQVSNISRTLVGYNICFCSSRTILLIHTTMQWNWFVHNHAYSMTVFKPCTHYNDVIMSTMASQITSIAIVYSTVYSDEDQRKHQSSASLAFARGIHRGPVNSTHKWPVTQKCFHLRTSSWLNTAHTDLAHLLLSSRTILLIHTRSEIGLYTIKFIRRLHSSHAQIKLIISRLRTAKKHCCYQV